MQKKVLIGMSGGVDSSVASLLLKNMGYDVAGVTLKLYDGFDESSISDASKVCEKLGIKHYVFDLRKQFKDYVISDFVSEYKAGRTPNPCIVCNKYIKFGQMMKIADELGFDMIATGHYAKILEKGGKYYLNKAKDLSKDQSYFLYNLTSELLSRTVFPLGDLTKAQIRETAEQNGFVNAGKKDSQDICFVPDGDYVSVIKEIDKNVSESGDYVDINGNFLGKHKGVINYTIGQRKGLSIALGKPQFVIDKNAETNVVVLGDEEHLFKTEVMLKDVNFVTEKVTEEIRVTAKLRYRHTASEATLYPLGNNTVKIVFDEPQRAPSSGQATVFYCGDTVVGGGIII